MCLYCLLAFLNNMHNRLFKVGSRKKTGWGGLPCSDFVEAVAQMPRFQSSKVIPCQEKSF